ncbi:MAG: AarF/ABC1/UbiB kinase family protein [Candidatus Sericytochromatia bacterium]|nr:AarF/ABC1/UbiB kinase family protein [Candidatus Sericytochromatia bacterium]
MAEFKTALAAPTPAQRRSEIASILFKHGLDTLLYHLSLVDFLPATLRGRLSRYVVTARNLTDEGDEVELRLPLPQVFRTVLEELGPTFVKLGQVLSTRADLLPPAYIQELSKLQEKVTAIDWSQMEAVLLEEWNGKIKERNLGEAEVSAAREIFQEFDPFPLAAGSIGQVYKATIYDPEIKKPQQVIVKLQRPGVEGVVEADLALLKDFARTLSKNFEWARFYNIQEIVEEFAGVIRGEMDFTREGTNTEIIGVSLKKHYAKQVSTPRVFWDYSGHRMLTLEFVEGVKISTLFPGYQPPLGSAPPLSLSVEQKKVLAQTITNVFLQQIFVDGFFHADPHPGNLMVRWDWKLNRPEIVIIDFGMVGRLDPRSRDLLIDFLLAIVQFDAARATERILEYGQPSRNIDRHALATELDHLLRSVLGKPIKEVEVGQLLQQILNLMVQYRVRMPPSFLMMARVFVTIEGINRQLDEEYMLIKVAEPFIMQTLTDQFFAQLNRQELARTAIDWRNIAVRTPRQLDDILTQLNAGRLRFEHNLLGTEQLQRTIAVIGNKISYSLLVAAMIMGAAIVMHAPTTYRLLGYPVLSLAIFSVSALMALWLLVSIMRSGTLRQ